MSGIFCNAHNAADDAVCTRRAGHDGHHCDTTEHRAWDSQGEVDCPAGYDHGCPPNRADRRGNVRLKPQHVARKFPGDPRG